MIGSQPFYNIQINMTDDVNQYFAVQPLGKYGHTYRLSRPTYLLYAWFTNSVVALLLLGIIYQFAFRPFFPGMPVIPDFGGLLLIIAVIAAAISVRIASLGTIVNPERENVEPFPLSKAISLVAKLHIFAGLILSAILTSIIGVSIVINAFFGDAKLEHVFVFIVLVFLVWLFNAARKKIN